MYRVMVMTDGKEYPLHDTRDDDVQLISPVVTQEVGKNCSFTFRIAARHPFKEKIVALRSEIIVYDNEDIIFCGRHIGDESDFFAVGKVTCEGELAYLLDSIQRPYEFKGSIVEFLRKLLDVHNSQVEERKRFTLGNVTIADSSSEVMRSSRECQSTMATMKTQLVGINGGYLRVRRSAGKKYLDYVSDYGGINSQVIRFGENLIDMTRYIDPTGIITALIPYGAMIKSKDPEKGEVALDITGVNGGKNYIHNQAAVDAYGWIWGTHTFEDVTDPDALLLKARAYLQECIAMPETLDLTAVDLALVDVMTQKLNLGYWTQVESVPHGISKRFMLSKKVINLDNPGKDSVILGQTISTFTGASNKEQMQLSERIKYVADSTSKEINRKVDNATNLITGGTGGYVVIDIHDPITGKKMHPWRILVMNTPDKTTAKNVIQINQNGIGFSTTGINGPYANAWTIDGNLVADFIATGTMLADRIRGGILEVGGSGIGRDGKIIVKDVSDKQIGYWDKTGLHVMQGNISGTDIYGSRIQSGSISGSSIDVGVFSADETRVDFGNFFVSDFNGRNTIRSADGSVILSEDTATASTLFCVGGNDSKSVFRASAASRLVYAQDIYLYDTGYGFDWPVGKCIKDLYAEIDALKMNITNK